MFLIEEEADEMNTDDEGSRASGHHTLLCSF
jgi:hypothetical protein